MGSMRTTSRKRRSICGSGRNCVSNNYGISKSTVRRVYVEQVSRQKLFDYDVRENNAAIRTLEKVRAKIFE